MSTGDKRYRHAGLITQGAYLRLLVRRVPPPSLDARDHFDSLHLGYSFASGLCLCPDVSYEVFGRNGAVQFLKAYGYCLIHSDEFGQRFTPKRDKSKKLG